MFKKIKIAFLVLFLLALLAPQVSFALDTRCWTEQACKDGGGVFYKPTNETKGVCGGETTLGPSGDEEPVGFCLPVGQAQTQVGFSGKKTFTNFGEFIKWMYQYGIQVAAVLAVVMIIVAGIQWATSGGSTERIGAARKRIGGALMGLFLALLSYALLNLINPYMVNLRLPQVWKINTLGLTPPYCDMITDGKKVSADKPNGPFEIEPTVQKNTTCGVDYFVQGTNGLTCKGKSCPNPLSVCSAYELEFISAAEENNKKDGKSQCFGDGNYRISLIYKVDSLIQKLAGGTGMAGALVNVLETSKWIDYGGSDGAAYWVRCYLESTNLYSYEKVNMTAGQKSSGGFMRYGISKENGQPLNPWSFEIHYYINDALINKFQNACDSKTTGSKLDSFFIRHEMNFNDVVVEWEDGNFYVSPTDGAMNSFVVGLWDDVKGNGGFPVEKIKTQSVFGTVSINQNVIDRVMENKGT